MYRGGGVSLRFATETRTSAHDAAYDAFTARKEEKEGKREIGRVGEEKRGWGWGVGSGGEGTERRIDGGENRGKE